jgi:hypothetical protein
VKIVPIIKPYEAQSLNSSSVKNIFTIAIVNMHILMKRKPVNEKNRKVFGQHIIKIEKL